ncbi:MAG: DNRLRE domain-containing protein [Chitinophagales bacterium]
MTYSRLNLIGFAAFIVVLGSCSQDPDITNSVPVANAGPSQTITLPFNNITLSGTGADQDGQVVAYLWSQVAGPGSTVIANPGFATTTVSGFVAGNYIFQLMVTDNIGATGVDTISIRVNPDPQITVTLQPANNPTDMSVAIVNGINQTGHSGYDIPIEAWTTGGNPVFIRSLLKFDWGAIPQTATIVSANLYLYSYPPPTPNGNFNDPNFGATNALTLQRASADWSPSTLTWSNQPAGASQGQILIPHTTSSILDINVDVTGLVSTMVANNANYGFLIKLQSEAAYNCRIFASSYYTGSAAKRPKLVIVYR